MAATGRSLGCSPSRLAEDINPVLMGWINYYGHFYKSESMKLLGYLNTILKKWARQKKLHDRKAWASDWLGRLAKREPNLFANWRIGVKP